MLVQSSHKVYTNSGNEDVYRLVKKPSSAILDVGCGGGSLAARLMADGHIVDGITLSDAEQHAAAEFCRDVFIYNLENGLPDEVLHRKYDYVICSHVLEHIVYPEQLLTHISKVLTNEGELIIALPNIMHYKSRFKLLSGNFNYEQAGIWDYTHVKWYTFKSACRLLEHHGYTLTYANVTGELPFNSIWKKVLPKRARHIMYKALTGLSKGFFGYQILLSAKLAR